MDLPLYSINTEKFYTLTGDMMEPSAIGAPVVSGIEVLANKVVKYLLTIQGSDVMDKTYGCSLVEYTQITKSRLPVLQLELVNALSRCTTYIKAGEATDAALDSRLHHIELTKLTYNPSTLRDTVHIYLKIVAQSGQNALLELPVGA